MGMTFIIDGKLYRNDTGTVTIPLPVGPFDSREAAGIWLLTQLPCWGSSEIVELHAPET